MHRWSLYIHCEAFLSWTSLPASSVGLPASKCLIIVVRSVSPRTAVFSTQSGSRNCKKSGSSLAKLRVAQRSRRIRELQLGMHETPTSVAGTQLDAHSKPPSV
eukprot:6196295-Pleurochrysis_carterae.AAC.3